MKAKGLLFLCIILLLPGLLLAQSTYLPAGHSGYHLLDRLETLSGKWSPELFQGNKPLSRRDAVQFLENLDLQVASPRDLHSLNRFLSQNAEWLSDSTKEMQSRRPWLKTFYKNPSDFFQARGSSYFLAVNPIVGLTAISEPSQANKPSLSNTRGVEVRARIANKLGIYTMISENQELPPAHVQQWATEHRALPGVDFTTIRSGKYDYMQARGYLDFALIRDHIYVTAGYDQHKIGDGYRSLLLSDLSAGATFLQLKTRIWRLQYQNLYLQLTPQFDRQRDQRLPHKYATMHHLSMNLLPWLNLGLFEAVVFSRPDRYEFSYMIPVIFYRQIERALGSPDNVLIGIDFKAMAARRLQFYGQFVLDEFTSKELFSPNGYWANKYGLQLGGKYFNAFGLENLDLQGEINMARPFLYTHKDTLANYTHYNQPLAHPLGASFREFLGIARYRPLNDLEVLIQGSYYVQGQDTAGSHYGSDIFDQYHRRTPAIGGTATHGYPMISGIRGQTAHLYLQLSYELRQNFFVDLGWGHRRSVTDHGLLPAYRSTYMIGSLRWNLIRRDYFIN